ncbi:MAG: LAGLIDADG family homing endonuclease [Candidatus Korarchaeota archaeon]|nr:LAGLIDADG family homing endonuclease [Candidatus Korarchaeota archaeon]
MVSRKTRGLKATPGGRRIPHDFRVELYYFVRELRDRGMSYREIQRIVERERGIKISRSHISYWIRGLHIPLNEPYNHVDTSKERELAWIAGMFVGDGSIKINRKGHFLVLKVKDRELAEAAADKLAVVLGRGERYAVNRMGDGRYYVQVQSRELVDHLRAWENILSHLERSPREFIQAFLDCEGGPIGHISASGRFFARIDVDNTDRKLLEAVSLKLSNMGIISTVSIHYPKGKVFVTRKGRSVARRNCYFLRIYRQDSIVRYWEEVGFVALRKREKLEDIAYILSNLGSGWEAAVEWIRRYEYKRGMGRQRWFRRKRFLEWEDALEEYERFLARRSSD